MVTTPRKPRTLEVFVYRNLHHKGVTWSVRQVSTGKVLFHSESVLLKNVKFKVSAKGREKVRKEKRKIVHAGVQGELICQPYLSRNILDEMSHWQTSVYYNPYTCESFVSPEYDNCPVYTATYALLTCDTSGKSLVKVII